jgi:DNA-binding CsgD family transcriptional regulator/tetratricopeptide (TPR) repeat protein
MLAGSTIGSRRRMLAAPQAPGRIRGRQREVSALEAQLRVLAEGRGSITVLEGAPGAGKTRLLAEAADIAGRLGVSVGAGQARRGDRVVMMGALLEAVAGGTRPLLPRQALRNLGALPDLRYWLVQEIEAQLEKAATAGPVLVSIDDLQWADGGTIGAVEALALRLAGLPIGWLVAWRPAEVPPEAGEALSRLEAAGALRLSLAPLPEAAIAEVVGDLSGATPDESLLRVAASAGGIPFWLSELVIGLREEGLLDIRDGHASTATTRLPARMGDSIQRRLTRMSGLARDVAAVGAALGSRFTFAVMADMLGASAAALLGPVDELIRGDILSDDGDALSFRHDILREAVLDSLPATARAALERQAATALLAVGLPPAKVAEQLAASAQPGDSEAIDVLLAAARSLGASDPAAASGLAQRALELTPGQDPRRGPLVAEVATLLHAAGRLEQATSFARTALAGLLPPEQESQVLFGIASMISLSADARAAAGRRALELPGLSPRDRARHQARLVHNLLVSGRRTGAQRLLDEVSDEVGEHGDKPTVFSLRLSAGGIRYEEGYFTESLERIDAAVRAGAVEGEDARARMAQQWRAEVLATVDRFDEAVQLAIDGLESARRSSQAWAIQLWGQWRGRQHYLLGEYSDAIAALEGILQPAEAALAFGAGYSSATSALAGTAIHVGDRQLMRDCARLATAMLERGTPEHRRHAAWVVARLAQAEGAAERAAQVLRDVAAGLPAGEPVLPCFPADVTDQVELVRMALAVGDGSLGRRAAELASQRASLNPGVDTVVAAAAHAQGLLQRDLELLRGAVARLERSPRRPALASALEDQGVIARAHGKSAEAIDAFGRALQLTVGMGASWDAARLRRRLRDMGVRRRLAQAERPERGWLALTASEVAVVQAITSGMTNREAAAHLFLSPHTVSTHMRHVFAKLEIRSRVELARIAADHGGQA